MQKNQPSISVVVPMRNEEDTLPELASRLRDVLPADAEIILIDDGSTDGTLDVLAGLVDTDDRIVGLRFLRSFGKSHALDAGFRRARGRVVAMIDADLQEDPAEIPRLVAALRDESALRSSQGAEGLDLITGWRVKRQDRALKVLASKIFNGLIRLVSRVPLFDINCGLKVMRREVVEGMRLEGGYHRFIPLLAHWRGYRVGELEIPHSPRRHGASRFGSERVLHGLIDFAVLLFLNRFERRPSRLFLTGGALSSFTGTAICAFLAYLRLSTGSIQSRFPLLALGVLLIVLGVQVIGTGFLAELVAQRRREEAPDSRVRAFEIAPERARAEERARH